MITISNEREFSKATIAQKDDEDYQESGWVALVRGDNAALAYYSHCSCYGTFEVLCGDDYREEYGDDGECRRFGSPRLDWSGSVSELIDMARRNADPDMPTRESSPDDYRFRWLADVYSQILAWNANGRPMNPDIH